ncbi:hypothetical protein LINGRAHAP2_LOCUS23948, partial [Linum grandiflorum]
QLSSISYLSTNFKLFENLKTIAARGNRRVVKHRPANHNGALLLAITQSPEAINNQKSKIPFLLFIWI